MIINVAQLLKESVGAVRYLDVSGDEELEAQGEVELVRTDRSVLVRGHLSTEVETTCSRCLQPISSPVNFDIEEEFFPVIDIVTGVALAAPKDPEAFTIDEGHILDLHEAVRQYAMLTLPIKRLCRSDCRGLCSACGHNLNQGACSCPKPVHDPRWAKLEQLLSRESAGGETARPRAA
jgi:uncharacterized protein